MTQETELPADLIAEVEGALLCEFSNKCRDFPDEQPCQMCERRPIVLAILRRVVGERNQTIRTQMTEIDQAHNALVEALPVGAPDSPPLHMRIAYLGQRVAALEQREKVLVDALLDMIAIAELYDDPGGYYGHSLPISERIKQAQALAAGAKTEEG